ncbi:hypothetical protein C8R45DRAFT_942082 [Mycena sanguinolenta]|nr:hypothetical protein C8R45DRAFT_942082 [Mycena sanguinolenta]
MSIVSRAISPWIQALWRVVRALFGGYRTGDLEDGTLVPVATKVEANQTETAKGFIPTFRPDIASVPALVLSSMAVGAAFAPDTPISIKVAHFPGAPAVPIILVTPPKEEEENNEFAGSPSKPVDAGRSPLRSITNVPRVHGKTQRRTHVPDKAKENIRLHPNVPRLCHHRVESATPSLVATTCQVATVASPEWERAKASQLKQAKEWSDAVKARRRSLPLPSKPTPSSHHGSLPARLSVSERLRLAVAGCASPLPAPAVVPPPLWGDDNVSFVLVDDEDKYEVDAINLPDTDHQLQSSTSLGSSTLMSSASSGSISSIIEAYETDFTASAWLGLRQFAESDEGNRSGLEAGACTRDVSGHAEYEGVGRGATSEDQEVGDDDHWSDGTHLWRFTYDEYFGTVTRNGHPRSPPSPTILSSGFLPVIGAWHGHPNTLRPPYFLLLFSLYSYSTVDFTCHGLSSRTPSPLLLLPACFIAADSRFSSTVSPARLSSRTPSRFPSTLPEASRLSPSFGSPNLNRKILKNRKPPSKFKNIRKVVFHSRVPPTSLVKSSKKRKIPSKFKKTVGKSRTRNSKNIAKC